MEFPLVDAADILGLCNDLAARIGPGKGKLVNGWQVIDPEVDLLRNSSD